MFLIRFIKRWPWHSWGANILLFFAAIIGYIIYAGITYEPPLVNPPPAKISHSILIIIVILAIMALIAFVPMYDHQFENEDGTYGKWYNTWGEIRYGYKSDPDYIEKLERSIAAKKEALAERKTILAEKQQHLTELEERAAFLDEVYDEMVEEEKEKKVISLKPKDE